MQKPITIGYFADGPWSHEALKRLSSDTGFNLKFICARHDNPDPVLNNRSKELGIPFFTSSNINSQDFLDTIKSHNCDILVSMSFNQIFKKKLINHAPMGIINCHAGKLPYYRGRNILNWALINDETEFGVTVHYIDEHIDTGDIILQESHRITDDDDYATLLERAYKICPDLLYSALKLIRDGKAALTKQKSIHSLGFYCTARKPGDEKLDWNQSSREVFNFVRAICPPGPSARCWLGEDEFKIKKVEYLPDAPTYKGIVGAVLRSTKEDFWVKTADSYVRVTGWEADRQPRVGDRFI